MQQKQQQQHPRQRQQNQQQQNKNQQHQHQSQQHQHQHQQHHVCKMLPTLTATTHRAQLLMLIAATTLLMLCAATQATDLHRATTLSMHSTVIGDADGGGGITSPETSHVAADPTAAAAAAAAASEGLKPLLGDNSSYNSRRDDEITAAQSENLLLQDIQHPAGHMVNLTRQHEGDVFHANGVTNCNADTCVGLSSGTAGLLQLGGRTNARSSVGVAGDSGHLAGRHLGALPELLRPKNDAKVAGRSCDCRCLSYLSTYREDLGICVDDIHECTLSPFVSGSSSEKIPFVFLPLRGQIIYPSREISLPDIRTPVCAVTGAQYLTTNGWTDLRNPIDTDYPFRMFRDEGRTFLQWLGEPDLRHKMQGRLIVVHLVCRDMTLSLNASVIKDHLVPPRNVFSPCVAFRVNGSPVKHFHNVTEVLFQAEATATLASTPDGMTTKEYVVIGVCSLLLGLIYVSSVFLYLHMKKRKNRDQSHHMRGSIDDLANEINYPKNDQVTFGAPFHRSGSVYSATSLGTSNEQRSRASLGSAVGGGVHLKEDGMGIVKNNPLLQHYPQLGEHHSGFASDVSNSNSECETDGGGAFHDKLKQLQTSALVHPSNGSSAVACGQSSPKGTCVGGNESPVERSSSPTQESECLPEENVSIVEEMMTEEKLEQMRQMVNGGTIRKKLYFNPAYFEPHLLAQPPPAAVDFLTKIREVISIAKYKMATKRYMPSLHVIPEEGATSSATASLYSSQLQMSGTDGCRGCVASRCTGHAKNCGDKRNSIEQWLQTVSSDESTKSGGHSSGDQQHPAEPDEGREAFELSSQQDRRSSPPVKHTCNVHRSTTKQHPPPPPPKPVHNSHNPHHSSPPPSPTPSPPRPHVIEIRNNTPYANASSSGATSCGNATTITVNARNYDAFATLSSVANMYGFAELGGELYNNPKFILHDSPAASQRSTHSSSYRSKSSRRRLDALDQYAAASTPTSLTSADREHYDMLRNMKQMPDMVYDTMARDYNATLPSSNGSCHFDIPTPDYDSTMEKKIKDIYSSSTALSSAPSVPTPDYSTLSRKSLRQSQPDSPIYRRKSPQYLIVDYETDSLERLNAAKHKSSQSSSSPSSDVSSQLSPSLSTALPMEEELEISHTVYDQVNGLRKDGNVKKKVAAKPESGGSKPNEIEARIKYDTPFLGSMTIEVDHEPPSDIELSTDSDQYEPDTLDRKPKKHSFCDVNAWTEHMQKAQHFVNSSAADGQHVDDHVSYQSLQNMNSLPSMGGSAAGGGSVAGAASPMYVPQIVNQCIHMQNSNSSQNKRPSFDSIREIYQPKLIRQNIQTGQSQSHSQKPEKLISDAFSEKGRLLTLEAKHTRRQRVTATPMIPPQIETEVIQNKTTIKIKTPNLDRPHTKPISNCEPENSTPANTPLNHRSNVNNSSKGFYDLTKNSAGLSRNNPQTPIRSINNNGRGTPTHSHKKPSPASPPPPPPSSASTTLNSHRSNASSQQHFRLHLPQSASCLHQNQTHFVQSTTPTEDETTSNHSESTEITRVSDTQATSEFDCSCDNTLNSIVRTSEDRMADNSLKGEGNEKSQHDSLDMKMISESKQVEKNHHQESLQVIKKLQDDPEYGSALNAHYNSLRNDYSLNKYLNRRKSQDHQLEDDPERDNRNDSKTEASSKNADSDSNKLDVISISSRSNRSSSRLSDRTKEMYRNAGVPVGIAYPQRSSANSATTPPTTNVQTVYRCEIEPMQLTHGMQIAMGLKDRAKKAKDLKNAWKKFVSRAAAKFSPTASPAPPFEKKTAASFLEALERDEGISSLIDDHPQVSTPKSSYSAPANQNYYEQRFGVARLQELDSGYMSADSSEMYKRSFYDRYNFRMMSGRDRVIRVDTIEDNSDGGSTITEQHNGSDGAEGGNKEEDRDDDGDGMKDGESVGVRRMDILDSNRFEEFENMGGIGSTEELELDLEPDDDCSDADSDKTLTRTNAQRRTNRRMGGTMNLYSSDDEQRGHSPSFGSSETDGETNAEDMWESGAESIETHSVLYKQVRKS